MIHYYAYYNHGGYKDLYLGNSEDIVASRYYLPLLAVYDNDPAMAEKVAEWKLLPSVINLSAETEEYNYPERARVMISHAGYKMQYRIIDGKGVFSLRDIGGNKDSYGRTCMFLMMMVADTKTDNYILGKVCHYVWKNLDKAESLFSSLFVNDFNVNGLRFDVAKLNEFLAGIVSSVKDSPEENDFKRMVQFFAFPADMAFACAMEEQQITKRDIVVAYRLGPFDSEEVYRYTDSADDSLTEEYEFHNPIVSDEPLKPGKSSAQTHSLRKALGFAKAEDLEALILAHDKLLERIAALETRIQILENNNK